MTKKGNKNKNTMKNYIGKFSILTDNIKVKTILATQKVMITSINIYKEL